jgi:CIC family chloride channel protein
VIDRVTSRLEIPRRLRAIVRARESSLIVLAALVGALAGLVVTAMGFGVDTLHRVLFHLGPGVRLSGLLHLDPVIAISVPLAGGIVFGIARELIAHWRPEREIDPIEANALHGGRMSLLGSIIVAAETVWSSGVGASVGMEAGYTQFASGIASRIGMAFRLRRADLRILVGCGAAGGIAGAFGAPLAGAFYGFELIIGGYTPNSLAPVAVSALIGYLVAQTLGPADLGVVAPDRMVVTAQELVIAALIGLLCAAAGIVIMRGVAFCEALFARLKLRYTLRTAIGGLLVGLLATQAPQVMSSGHGALHFAGMLQLSLVTVALLFVLKIVASVISLGSGFRGGVFFSSLLIGALGGHLLAVALTTVFPSGHFDSNAYAVISMGGLSAAVIGGPMTMTFIALESTGDLWLTAAVLIAVIISSQLTREFFGYSFATWRFHLRGETIRSAADVGWLRDLTVGRMMRRDVKTISSEMTVPAFREAFPPGSTGQVVAVDNKGRYAGLVMVAEAHAAELAESAFIFEILRHADDMLLPSMTVQEAISAFDRTESEVLAVVDAPSSRRVLGTLSEAHALRRYLSELELQRREYVGAP